MRTKFEDLKIQGRYLVADQHNTWKTGGDSSTVELSRADENLVMNGHPYLLVRNFFVHQKNAILIKMQFGL